MKRIYKSYQIEQQGKNTTQYSAAWRDFKVIRSILLYLTNT